MKKAFTWERQKTTQKTILERHLSSLVSQSAGFVDQKAFCHPHKAKHRQRSWRLGPWGQQANSLHSADVHWVCPASKALHCAFLEENEVLLDKGSILRSIGNGRMWSELWERLRKSAGDNELRGEWVSSCSNQTRLHWGHGTCVRYGRNGFLE